MGEKKFKNRKKDYYRPYYEEVWITLLNISTIAATLSSAKVIDLAALLSWNNGRFKERFFFIIYDQTALSVKYVRA